MLGMLGEISLEDIWREHRRFILSVGGGAVVFLAGLSAIAGVEGRAAAVAKENRRLEREIEELSEELAAEPYEAGVAEALAATIGPGVRAAVELSPREGFALAEGASPYLVYKAVLDQVLATRGEGLKKNIPIPEDLGFPANPPEERIREAIAVADAADRVLRALILADVRQVESFRPGEVDYVSTDVEDEPGRDRKRPPGDELVLRRIPIRAAFTSTLEKLQTILAAFQRSGSCYELAGARLARVAPAAGAERGDGPALVRADLELAALALVPPSEAPALDRRGPSQAPGARRGLAPRGGGRR